MREIIEIRRKRLKWAQEDLRNAEYNYTVALKSLLAAERSERMNAANVEKTAENSDAGRKPVLGPKRVDRTKRKLRNGQ